MMSLLLDQRSNIAFHGDPDKSYSSPCGEHLGALNDPIPESSPDHLFARYFPRLAVQIDHKVGSKDVGF
jgi:hypothetical protein